MLGCACGPAVEAEDDLEGSGSSGDEIGERPTAAGSMYSSCDAVAQCEPLEFCVFPPGESGFCSAACGAGPEPSTCDPAPGQGAALGCLDISLPDARQVCALDCSDGACPAGMRCEGIETPDGARRICF